MATARCLSINFSSISSNCFSALRCCFNFGGCLKPRKPSDIGSQSQINSSDGDVYAADDVPGNNSSDSTILLGPENNFQLTQNLEDQNPGPIWINSVSVDLSHNEFENISQNPTTYNAPVRINEENNGQAIEIQSIFNNPVKNSGDEEMDELATSHMDEFSKLMSLGVGEANVGDCEAKLPTPMRQVDELASNGDSIYEAMGPIFTKIDGGDVNMSNPIEKEVLVRDLESCKYTSVPKVLQCKVVEDPGLRITLSEYGLDSSREDSDPASPKPPLSESLGPIQPVLDTLPSKQDTLLSSSGEFSVDDSFDEGSSHIEVWGGGNSRKPREKPKSEKITMTPSTEDSVAAKIAEEIKAKLNENSLNKAVNLEWYEMFSPEKLGEFFGNSSEKVSSRDFFENLSIFVNEIKEKVVPNPTPANTSVGARAENHKKEGMGSSK